MSSKILAVLAVLFLPQALVPKLVAQGDLNTKNSQPHYRLVDLGTFGGPVSLVFGGTGNLNQHKALVTSCADTSVLDSEWPNINLWLGDDPYIQHGFWTRRGRLHDLGVLPGGTSSCGQGINAHGGVAGFSTTGDIDSLTGYREIHAARWQHGEILDLGRKRELRKLHQ
jgi:hypothetical protein